MLREFDGRTHQHLEQTDGVRKRARLHLVDQLRHLLNEGDRGLDTERRDVPPRTLYPNAGKTENTLQLYINNFSIFGIHTSG